MQTLISSPGQPRMRRNEASARLAADGRRAAGWFDRGPFSRTPEYASARARVGCGYRTEVRRHFFVSHRRYPRIADGTVRDDRDVTDDCQPRRDVSRAGLTNSKAFRRRQRQVSGRARRRRTQPRRRIHLCRERRRAERFLRMDEELRPDVVRHGHDQCAGERFIRTRLRHVLHLGLSRPENRSEAGRRGRLRLQRLRADDDDGRAQMTTRLLEGNPLDHRANGAVHRFRAGNDRATGGRRNARRADFVSFWA